MARLNIPFIPEEEFKERVAKVQKAMKEDGFDLILSDDRIRQSPCRPQHLCEAQCRQFRVSDGSAD